MNVRVSGEKINALAREMVAAEPMVESLTIRFFPGLIRVEGVVRKFLPIPFSVEITQVFARGTVVRVPLARMTAGPIPIPSILLALIQHRLPAGVVTLEPPSTLVLSLERFLPAFVRADVQEIRLIEGGLAVALGAGGADIPSGGSNDRGKRPGSGNV
ncbi:MAG: hypothetical protein WA208_13555 [Thermoanaerobaculia bacterium]